MSRTVTSPSGSVRWTVAAKGRPWPRRGAFTGCMSCGRMPNSTGSAVGLVSPAGSVDLREGQEQTPARHHPCADRAGDQVHRRCADHGRDETVVRCGHRGRRACRSARFCPSRSTAMRSAMDQRLQLVGRGIDHGHAELAMQPFELRPRIVAKLGVQVGKRLVQQQQAGPPDQGAADRDALLLAAGQCVRLSVDGMADPQHLRDFVDPALNLVRRPPLFA